MEEALKSFSIDEIAKEAVERGASDIHITAGTPPMIRLSGSLVPLQGYPSMTPKDTQQFIYSFMNEKQKKNFEEKKRT